MAGSYFRRPVVAGLVSVALLVSANGAAQAGVAVVAAPPPGAGPGPAPAAGILGIAAALGLYDLLRRTTCSGDFLRLGGPGFGQPLRPADNAIPPPNCGQPSSGQRGR